LSPVDSNIIIACATVIAALLGLIGVLLGMIHKNAKTAASQTQNSHTVNLRDDLDEKFDGLAGLVRGVSYDVGGVKEDIRIIRRDQSADRAAAADAAHAASEALRLAREAREAIERTQPNTRKRNPHV
jgi:cell division protein FtsX